MPHPLNSLGRLPFFINLFSIMSDPENDPQSDDRNAEPQGSEGHENQDQDPDQDQQENQNNETQQQDDPNVFLTQQKLEQNQVWRSFDFLFPAGKLAKLVKFSYSQPKTFPYMEILTKLKLDDGFPVVNFIGARHDFENVEKQRGKFYAGIARACHNTDAVIVDNGVTTGIEKFSLRRNCTLIGVAREADIKYPKLNPTKIDPNQLSNGHTHIMLMAAQEKEAEAKQQQGDDFSCSLSDLAAFKINLCKRIATGKISKNNQGRPRCKIVNVLFADDEGCFDEIREAIINQLPIIVVRGSKHCNQFIEKTQIQDKEFEDIMSSEDAHFYPLDNLNSEIIAQALHYLLTFTPYIKLNKQSQAQ